MLLELKRNAIENKLIRMNNTYTYFNNAKP